MESFSTLDTHPQDNLQKFKEKVKDAISHLPKIPEDQRREAWKFWQLVSVAVKVAVGGRGSAVPTHHERRQKRRVRSLKSLDLLGRVTEHTVDTVAGGVRSENNDCDEDGKAGNLLQKEMDAERRSEVAGGCYIGESSVNSTATVITQEEKVSVATPTAASCSDATTTEGSSNQDFSCQFDSESKSEDADSESQCLNNLQLPAAAADCSSNVSAKPDIDGSVLAIPFPTNSAAVAETSVITNASQASETLNSGTQVPSQVPPLKRKRGRPRKIVSSVLRANHASQEDTIADMEPSANKDTASVVKNEGQPKKVPVTCPPMSSSVEDSGTHQTSATNFSELPSEETVHDFDSTDSAPKDENFEETSVSTLPSAESAFEKISVSKTSCANIDVQLQAPSSNVRRSERRSVPNRDKLYCYFDRPPSGNIFTTERGPEFQEIDIKFPDVNDLESKPTKYKTKKDNSQERTCPVCKIQLCFTSSMAAHLRTHTGDRPFTCQTCGRGFTTKANCERHEATHIGLKAFTCPECNKSFTEKKSMKIHMRSHTGERPYECKICGMRFFQTGTLRTHLDRHTGRKAHLCDFCGKAFRQRSQLRVHVQRHTKHTPYSCTQCKKTFYTKSDKERHMSKHTGARPFSCGLCERTFTRLQYLREHENLHLGVRPYECSECGMKFPDRGSCYRHVQRHRNKDKQEEVQKQDTKSVEITALPEGKMIFTPQGLALNSADGQTYIVASSSYQQSQEITSASASAATATVTSPKHVQAADEAIFNSLGLKVSEGAEVYHVTLVDSSAGLQGVENTGTPQTVSGVDFSAINLLASATTQLSLPQ